jgi:hypothetical protein
MADLGTKSGADEGARPDVVRPTWSGSSLNELDRQVDAIQESLGILVTIVQSLVKRVEELEGSLIFGDINAMGQLPRNPVDSPNLFELDSQ